MSVLARSTRRPATRRQLLESLENRQLMAATSVSINFQPSTTATPSGFIADTGKAYTAQNGFTYGWNVNNSVGTRDRATSASTELDTLAHFGSTTGPASKWELAVPNGAYTVTITSGDAGYIDSHFAINAENVKVLDAVPTNASKWATGTANVTVTDGKLTITSAAGASNNKINSIKVVTATAAPAGVARPGTPNWISAAASGSSTAVIRWGDISNNESGFIIEQSTDNKAWTESGRVGGNVTTFTAAGLQANTHYYFRVKAYNAGGTSNPSALEQTTTAKGTTSTPAPTTVPPVVGNLNVTATGQTTATVSWSDVGNETGYRVQRSADGKSFSNIASVGANVTSFGDTGLKAATKYYYRIQAFNNVGTSTTGIVNATTNSASTTTTPPPAGNTGGGSVVIPNSNSLSGISANGNGADANQYKGVLEDVGIKNVRIWYNVDWNSKGVDGWYAQRAASYKAAGFSVMLCVVNENPTDYNTAKAFYTRLASDAGLRKSVDYWQINNEPNIAKFWSGSLSQYVNTCLKPGYEALHAVGETVVGAGPSWDVNVAKQLQSLGYSNYCDYAAFHPYGDNAQQVIDRATGAKAAFGNKPIMFTEWNVSHVTDTTKWVGEINKAAVGLAKIGVMSYYFAMVNSDTHVGNGGLLNTNGTRNTPFYNAVKDWLN